MAQKLTRAREREIREDIRQIVAGRVRLISVGDLAGAEKEYHDQVIQELAEQIAGRPLNVAAYTRELADRQRPGIEKIREELRRAGIQEELIDGQAKQLWQDRQRAGQLGGGQ